MSCVFFSTIPAHLALIGAKPCGTGGLYLKHLQFHGSSKEIDLGRVTIAFFDLSYNTFACIFHKARLRRNKTGRIKRSITVANHPGNPLQSGNPNRAYEDLTSSYHRLLNHLKAHKSNPSTHANPLGRTWRRHRSHHAESKEPKPVRVEMSLLEVSATFPARLR